MSSNFGLNDVCELMHLGELINEKDRCKTCHGKKVTQESKNIEIVVGPGMRDGEKITLHGEGDQMVRATVEIISLVM